MSFGSGSVREILEGNRFEAAEVQRQYVWETGQQDALFRDLLAAYVRDAAQHYYLGTLLLYRPHQGREALSVVYDGQQRLTTICLLVCALARRAGPDLGDLRGLLVQPDGEPRIRIRSRGGFLKRCINGTERVSEQERYLPSDWRMKRAYTHFQARAREMFETPRDCETFLGFVLDRAQFAYVAAAQRSAMTGIFVRANARGVPLSWADRLKGHIAERIIATARDPLTQEKLFDQFWYRTVARLEAPEAALLPLARAHAAEDVATDEDAIEGLFKAIEAWTPEDAFRRFDAIKRAITSCCDAAPRTRRGDGEDEPPATAEQTLALQSFAAGRSFRIVAFAGTGKSATLRRLARATTKPVLYVAFNKQIVVDAERTMPANTTCRTINALAHHCLAAEHFTPAKLRAPLDEDAIEGALTRARLAADAWEVAAIWACIMEFLRSSDAEIGPQHVASSGAGAPDTARTIALAQAVWRAMSDAACETPLSFDGTVKLWSLRAPSLGYEIIMVDEAQDTSRPALSVLRAQRAQVIYAGDPHQQIYEWRGAVDALNAAQVEDERHLTQTFRFGANIAHVANTVLSALGEPRRISPNPAVEDNVGPCAAPDIILARSNAGVFRCAAELLERGGIPHIVGRAAHFQHLIESVAALQAGKPAFHPDLTGFRSWPEVETYSQTVPGRTLAPIVQLVRVHGVDGLKRIREACASGPGPGVTSIGTAFSVKGMEWDGVRIAPDFFDAVWDRSVPRADARLLYVAVTRARRHLDPPPGLLEAYMRVQDAP